MKPRFVIFSPGVLLTQREYQCQSPTELESAHPQKHPKRHLHKSKSLRCGANILILGSAKLSNELLGGGFAMLV